MLSEFEYRDLRKPFSRFYISNNGSINTTSMCFLRRKNSNHRLEKDFLSHPPPPPPPPAKFVHARTKAVT